MKPKRPSPKQPTPKELTDSCLGLLRAKFYAGDDKGFFQERTDLLRLVVLFPAKWLNDRAVTIHGDKYREIFNEVFIQAAAHVVSKIKYRPAYFRQVIQSHMMIHGEEYYEAAKATRNAVDDVLLLARHAAAPLARADDPVRKLAELRDVLAVRKGKKQVAQPTVKKQLNLFG